jgi:hypothetical protein
MRGQVEAAQRGHLHELPCIGAVGGGRIRAGVRVHGVTCTQAAAQAGCHVGAR